MLLEAKNLSYSYKKGKVILEDISFSIDQGEYVCLLGPNGVGKSTLFKCMLGLLPGYTGQICLQGKDIRTLSPRQLARQVAYVPQQTQHTFAYAAEDVVLMGTTPYTSAFASPGEKERRTAQAAMERMGVLHLSNAPFTQLSGGEKQLVLIARALAQQARLLFMDEPTASLDYGNQIRVLEQISALTRDGYTVVQSTHNPEQAFLYAKRVLAVKDRGILADGDPSKVMTGEKMRDLYGIDVAVESLYQDRVRVCVPASRVCSL